MLYLIADDTCSPYYVIPWEVDYISEREDDGDCPALHVTLSDQSGRVVVTGLSWYDSSAQWDFGTACYLPEP